MAMVSKSAKILASVVGCVMLLAMAHTVGTGMGKWISKKIWGE